jgi:hypothetical protein
MHIQRRYSEKHQSTTRWIGEDLEIWQRTIQKGSNCSEGVFGNGKCPRNTRYFPHWDNASHHFSSFGVEASIDRSVLTPQPIGARLCCLREPSLLIPSIIPLFPKPMDCANDSPDAQALSPLQGASRPPTSRIVGPLGLNQNPSRRLFSTTCLLLHTSGNAKPSINFMKDNAT